MARPDQLRIISLNCWGLKYISTHRIQRLAQIGTQLTLLSPHPDIVCLQECWCPSDFETIHHTTKHFLPHAKFFYSGIFGSGLVVLSRYDIVETEMRGFSLNGRPTAFFRGDWFVGKGVGRVRVRIGEGGRREEVDVLTTHLHAPYRERGGGDSYSVHRVAQAWEVAGLIRRFSESGRMVVACGDFNMVPGSLEWRVMRGHCPGRDAWQDAKGEEVEGVLSVREALGRRGATCDSVLNTWRWSKQHQKDLRKGRDRVVEMDEVDPEARRLDYVFVASEEWDVRDATVGMTMRHPELKCSLSDHFAVDMTLQRQPASSQRSDQLTLPLEIYDEILNKVAGYVRREQSQQKWRLRHFGLQLSIAIGCFIAVWWSPRNFVSFILMLVSALGLSAGVVDGLIGGLFMTGELRALKEFEYEICNARRKAELAEDAESENGKT